MGAPSPWGAWGGSVYAVAGGERGRDDVVEALGCGRVLCLLARVLVRVIVCVCNGAGVATHWGVASPTFTRGGPLAWVTIGWPTFAEVTRDAFWVRRS